MSKPAAWMTLSILFACITLLTLPFLVFDIMAITGLVVADAPDPRTGRLSAYQPHPMIFLSELLLVAVGPVVAYRMWRHGRALDETERNS